MADDPFVAVKSILEDHVRKQRRDEARAQMHFESLRAACERIANIHSQEPENGLELAKHIAKAALDDSARYYDGL